MGIFSRLKWFFKNQWKQYLIGVIALIIVAIVNVIPPKIIGNVVDAVSKRNVTGNFLLVSMLIFLGTAIAQYLLRFLWRKNDIWKFFRFRERFKKSALSSIYEDGCYFL
jgi:ABC-type multidrug transport system, ATPase and permease components